NLLLGSQWNPTVNIRVSLTFVPTGQETRIVADTAAVTNPGTAFEQITPITNPKANDGIQNWLYNVQAEFVTMKPVAAAKR
ncbi:hypothetical protein WHK35_14555, partial [Staphylococcus aureus]|uniref:hypothetical protein n=1 Tax=Staphylococcus aureus TaxID=1280 RepID=UPI0039BE50EA